jgi:hypothetical protein
MQELGLEVNDDLINFIMTQNGVDIESLKNNHANELQTLQTELSSVKEELTQAKAKESQYADYEELKQFKTDTLLKVENEQKIGYLKEIKCKYPELFVDKFDWTKATYNQEKKTYEGLEEQIKKVQEQYAGMFDVQQQQIIDSKGGGNTITNLTGVEKHFYELNPDLRK